MGKNDQTALIIVSALTLILVFGLLFKSYMVLFPGESLSREQADSTSQQVYDNEVLIGPARVEDVTKPSPAKDKPAQTENGKQKKEQSRRQEKSHKVWSGKAFIVVSGAFSSKKNAEERQEVLAEKGYSPEIFYQKDRGLYLVYLMKFKSKAQADNYSQRTKTKGLDNFIKIIKQ